MDLPLETTSPRRKDKIAEAIQSMANLNNNMEPLELPTDPDAQATVTDFLDFTEYLPSDMIRSITLIGNLDRKYRKASRATNEQAEIYGRLPDIPVDEKPNPVSLRSELSESVSDAVSARTLSYAEACRMADNVDRHYNRAKNILAKLKAMLEAYPPSREPSPAPEKPKSPVIARTPKITLRLDGSRTDQTGGPRVRRHRAPRITVPGEVLAPYEFDYESYGSESDDWDSAEDEPPEPRQTPARSLTNNSGRIKLKVQKPPKNNKTPKQPRPPRPPGVMGTNVHSSVAGISTSNALAKLNPPPENAEKGSEHAPWLQLTEWELGMLRKRMKKNAVWSPSDTMIARELKQLGRGIEAYRAAKSQADATGQPFDQPVPPQLLGQAVLAEGAISVEAVQNDQDLQLSNRGMKLNEAKKLKKENQAKEAAKQAAEEAEESARKVAEAAKVMKGLFSKPASKDEKKTDKKTPTAVSKTPARKRKRESNAGTESPEKVAEGEPATAKQDKPERPPPLKRTKTETPVPAPQPIASKEKQPPALTLDTQTLEPATAASSEAAPVPAAEVPAENVTAPSPKKSSTPILPPVKEPKKETKVEVKKPEKVANTRARRSSIAAITAQAPAPAPEPLPPKRPTSSRSKAASLEPAFPVATATIDRPRRASTARNTPAPEPRQPSKRTKRPAPGIVTAGHEGSAAVSVGKRSAATRKKASTKKDKKDGREGSAAQEVLDEVDDEGNVIDPDEPRYCLCNRVSFGTMIACENGDCEKEWFHLECVNLTDVPPRTTKWYCPECRIKLGIGEKGEVTARGRKK
ncbi:hypothetical protein M430DRAFT_49514 [Amorphotheca resinae ATCC 22711]|uniref:PHD-type domain-containing protein n=1 Tax=Amorphotheca resinae ATCC 22711 TaxID=857342 RepID=A0A2T3B6L5_AMORE|nr:hypothetical protein M430DRAFT_49514 [Amorphotheca resinae ATCC 22711]PSS22386.1 hypothetical protein M430DRAFT_49514 [Amorphotheca resinae ATCC 22711]